MGEPISDHRGNQARAAGGTAPTVVHNTILYPNSKNPKGNPGWGETTRTYKNKQKKRILKDMSKIFEMVFSPVLVFFPSASGQTVGPHMGAGLLSFVLSYIMKMSPPEIREASFASRLVTKSIVFLPYKYFPDFRW